MLVQKPTDDAHGIFLHCEASDTAGISRGDLLMWDLTDNRTTLGRNTLGIRVTGATGANASVYMRIAGVAIDDAPALAAGKTPGKMILVQCYGLCNALSGGATTAQLGQAGPPTASTGHWLAYFGTARSLRTVKTPGSIADGLIFCGFSVEDQPGDASYGIRKVWLRGCMS